MNAVMNKQMEGCFPLAAHEYHQDKAAWSKGMLWDFRERRSVCHARHILGTAPPFKTTGAMDIGDVSHVALLQPEKLATHYVTFPNDILSSNGAVSTKAAKEFKAEHESAGRVVLKESEFSIVKAMVNSVTAKVGKWLSVDARIEHAIYWTDETTDIRCKCRPDFLVVDQVRGLCVCLDIKTTGDASPKAFRYRLEDCGYWLQDRHYSAGIRSTFSLEPQFLFVAVETQWPFECGVYELSDWDKEQGDIARNQTLVDVDTCIETGDWSDDWSRRINTISLRQHVYA